MKNCNKSLVSIVTVTYNAEDLIEETILSVINQSYENIEYIIIDAASYDDTLKIIKKYENSIAYWISELDDGIYYAMNKAIEKASGKWINFMNAGDTFFDLDTVAYVMNHKNNNTDLIYGNFQIKESGVIKKAWDKSQWYFHMPFCHQTLFTRTKLMKEEQFDTHFRLAADHNFIVKMYKNQKKFDYLDRTLATFSLGGFAESNKFLMKIESLKVLLDHKIYQNEIKKSYWYKELNRDIYTENKNQMVTLEKVIQDKEKFIEIQEEQINNLYTLQKAIEQIASYSILKHPLKKYRSYRSMLLLYYKIKNLSIGKIIDDK